MCIRDRVLACTPETWTHCDYGNKRYTLIKVDSLSDEYSEVTAPFALFESYTIENVERIQNPYALGSFMIRKEQLTARGHHVTEVSMICVTGVPDMERATIGGKEKTGNYENHFKSPFM